VTVAVLAERAASDTAIAARDSLVRAERAATITQRDRAEKAERRPRWGTVATVTGTLFIVGVAIGRSLFAGGGRQ